MAKCSQGSTPLVSVVTPVYNGERYLAECVESVLSQTYRNWEYILVNNRSTDRTSSIINSYANDDDRIHVYENEVFLKVIENWNRALKLISPASKYCKVVHADDWLFPECLERMVSVAEQNPSVGVVGSYVLWGDRVEMDGLPYPSTVVPGRQVCRGMLRRDYSVFGSPSSILICSDLIRRRDVFYNEDNFHADDEVCYEILRERDFGFVHQVLTYTRLHNEALTTTVAIRYNTMALEQLGMLKRYGPIFLEKDEYEKYSKAELKRYYGIFAKNLLRLRARKYWGFQKQGLEKNGFRLSLAKLIGATCLLAFDLLLNPKMTFEKISALLRK